MKARRSLACVGLLLLAATAVVIGRTPAQAAPAPCTVQAHFAARIGVSGPLVSTPTTLSGCSGTLGTASAQFGRSGRLLGAVSFNRARTGTLSFPASRATPGSYVTMNGTGGQQNGGATRWTYTSATVKFDQRLTVAVSRNLITVAHGYGYGDEITFRGSDGQYVSGRGWLGAVGHVVWLQQYTSRGWINVAGARTGVAGAYLIQRYSPYDGVYRLATADTAADFGKTVSAGEVLCPYSIGSLGQPVPINPQFCAQSPDPGPRCPIY
jgi:hypothetical protein